MNNDRSDCQLFSRRVTFTRTALVLGAAAAAAVVPKAAALQKISKEDAKYQSTPKGDQRCDGCISFQPPSACKFVQGDVSASGWCELFASKIPKDLKR